MDKILLGISSCLLGNKVRYDGGHKLDIFLKDTLGKYVNWYPVCPEVECGLPVPREAMRLVGDIQSPRLVTIKTGIDLTDKMKSWIDEKLNDLAKLNLCGFVFKSKSPSSGMRAVKVYGQNGIPVNKGIGLFAKAFMDRFPLIPVEDEGRLNDASLRENFIERIFVYFRWQRLITDGLTPSKIVDFHTNHKFLIMSHSVEHYRLLGKLIAEQKKYQLDKFQNIYISALMEGLKRIATVKKNVNVLQHIMGYFKDKLSSTEKEELLEVIDNYHKGYLPLIVPITLLNHYVRLYDEPYTKRQFYLNPHPIELMLRNHV
ncbi:MAG: DUF523 and DUF1722 domain-containing protein [Thermodesulfovibrionales bacterium]|nr:DUF523 and DUF1722 domain-containing protein [Thermodesulfovibrionales bacterium]